MFSSTDRLTRDGGLTDYIPQPTDEALLFDIVKTREMGFNTIRKHVKVEPARWYYHCDKTGMLVWQDMQAVILEADNGIHGLEWRADQIKSGPKHRKEYTVPSGMPSSITCIIIRALLFGFLSMKPGTV